MATTTRIHQNGSHELDSHELEQEIAITRREMDRTLNEIGDRLHPKHLLDEAMDLFRSDSSSRVKARQVLDQAACKVRQHPGPALLGAAAAIWYLMQDDEPASQMPASRRRQRTYAAWEQGYDWSTSQHNEQTWSERARQSLDDMRRVVGDTATSAKDKVRSLAGSLIGVSGHSREQLRERIHSQWADLREHSGSFVDARTGQPYDDSYGEEWSCLENCACLESEDSGQQEEGWNDKAQQALGRISETLSSTGGSVKDQLSAIGGQLSGLASGARSAAARTGNAAGDRVRHMASSTGQGMRSMAEGTRRGAANVQQSMQDGLRYTRDQLSDGFDQYPIVTGAACLGLGLLAGLILPTTRRENELMGDASDQLKEQVTETGKDMLQRGQQMASAAASAATEEAQKQGLTPENLGQAVKQTASASAQAAKEEMPTRQEFEQKAGFQAASGSTTRSQQASSDLSEGPACDI
jgi:hypothetical protein